MKPRFWYFAELNERGGVRDRFGPFASKHEAALARRRAANLYREKRLDQVRSSIERFLPPWVRVHPGCQIHTLRSADAGIWRGLSEVMMDTLVQLRVKPLVRLDRGVEVDDTIADLARCGGSGRDRPFWQ